MLELSEEAVKPPRPGESGWVALALGSNLGDREGHLAAARAGLADGGFVAERVSSIVETAAVGGPEGQGAFLNQVLAARCAAFPSSPLDLLRLGLDVEVARGRVRSERWGPRTLDVDLLVFGARCVDVRGLTLPHPRMLSRIFVLGPLAEILPEQRHPVTGRTFSDHLGELREAGSKLEP
jgi:2-amino-4-hydroxy-6-hydroxymethyldihydropteridine diphosphokinase